MKYVVYLTHYEGKLLPLQYIGSSNKEKIKNGNQHGLEIIYEGKEYKNIKELCGYIEFSEKNIRKLMKINNIKYINDIIINTMRDLRNLEPQDKKWLNRKRWYFIFFIL